MEAQRDWPVLPERFDDSVTVFLAPTRAMFDSLTEGRLPDWGAGAAFPESQVIVLLVDGAPFGVLRHEVAHLALHSALGHVPTWFSEGFAIWGAGEWGRMDQLKLNLELVTGRVPTLAALNAELRGESGTVARAAYAMAASAVATLARWGGERGLSDLIEAFSETGSLDAALRRTHLITLGQFEERWRKELRSRYGWMAFLTSFSVFWVVIGGGLVYLRIRRRRRDRERKRHLDDGWLIPEEEWRSVDDPQ